MAIKKITMHRKTTTGYDDIYPKTEVSQVEGLQTELNSKQDLIDSTHKLSADLVNDSSTTNKFVTAGEKTSISTAIQPNDNISELTNDAGYVTSSYHDNTKQDKLPTVVNNKYLHTNSSTGALEWSDADALPSQTGQSGKFLTTNGTAPSWATITIPEVSDMTGATGSTPGTHGLVPAPAAGDQNKFLKGDATWGEMVASNTARVPITLVEGTTSYSVNHGLNTRDVTVQVYDSVTYETIIVDVERTSLSNVTVTFNDLPGGGSEGLHNCVALFTAMSLAVVPSGEEVSY